MSKKKAEETPRKNPLQVKFLEAYRHTGNVSRAAKLAEVSRQQHYEWLNDAEYSKAFEDAHAEAVDILEGEARRRAVEGVEEKVFQQGREVGVVTKYSDKLLMFLLQGTKPEKFRTNHKVEVTGEIDIIARLQRGRARARGEEVGES
jgi:hypothetical protein